MIKDDLFALCAADCIGTVGAAADCAAELLTPFCDTVTRSGNNICGIKKGETNRLLLLDAHIDEIGFVVTNVDENGFLTVAKAGGIDLRTLPARAVTVHGRQPVPAVFCSTPPHLSAGETAFEKIADFKVDSLLGAKASESIAVGDYACYRQTPQLLGKNRMTAKALDDRAGVACLIEVARRLQGVSLPFGIAFLCSDQEELGGRGAAVSTFRLQPDTAVAMDVSFGDGPGIDPYECGKLGCGVMIGKSPLLDSRRGNLLVTLAQEKNIAYQIEVMGGRTGTNGDIIAGIREGVPTALLSIPLRNMHTDCEVVDFSDLDSVCDLLTAYILSGGALND